MTLYQFLALDEMKQAEAVWEGTLVGNKEDEEHSILLYAIDSFYVEVFYHKKYNVIRKFPPFTITALLASYLNGINIDTLLYPFDHCLHS